jgi:hypothetical protein
VLERLIDHAALFPPASMSMPEALAEDRRARRSIHSELLNRFVVPVGKLSELPDEHPPLSVVLGSAADAPLVAEADRVEAVELMLDGARPQSADLVAAYALLQPLRVETYFELVFDATWRDSLPAAIGAIAAMGGRVKLRCGGEAVPTVEQVALVIASCREARVPFKATAGLHHAVRNDGEHGFLNILAAATAPRGGIARVLAEEDASALEPSEEGRSLFKSFGSCSWQEPVDELEELGLLS